MTQFVVGIEQSPSQWYAATAQADSGAIAALVSINSANAVPLAKRLRHQIQEAHVTSNTLEENGGVIAFLSGADE